MKIQFSIISLIVIVFATAASAERFFRHIGVWDKFKPTFMGYSAAASAFKDGKIDAFWVLVGFPNRSIIEASVQEKIHLGDQ